MDWNIILSVVVGNFISYVLGVLLYVGFMYLFVKGR